MKHQFYWRLNLMVLLAAIALFISACGATIDTEITLYAAERFDITSRITVSAQQLALVGGPAILEQQFTELDQQAQAEGVKFDWRKEKSQDAANVVYSMGMSGTGYDNLATYGLSVEKTQYKGKEALAISASTMGDLSGAQNTMKLHVGSILQTNNQRSGNTIIWDGSGSLEAIVTPKGSTNWLLIILIVVAVVGAAIVAFLFLRRPATRPQAGSMAAPSAGTSVGFCPYCGQPVQPGSKFCMSCGQPFPRP